MRKKQEGFDINLKKAVRRFLTLALTPAMICGLGLTARAAETCGLWVGGTEVTADNLNVTACDRTRKEGASH